MRVLLLTLTLAAVALAGCTDDSDTDTSLGDIPSLDPILADVGDPLGNLDPFSAPVPMDFTPAQDELCEVGRIGIGEVEWDIPDVDPETGGAWAASEMTVDVSAIGQSANAGTGFVAEVIAPDGSQIDTIEGTADQGGQAVISQAEPLEAGTYKFIVHACDSATGLVEQAESTSGSAEASYQVDASASMVATETVYGEAEGSASGDASGATP